MRANLTPSSSQTAYPYESFEDLIKRRALERCDLVIEGGIGGNTEVYDTFRSLGYSAPYIGVNTCTRAMTGKGKPKSLGYVLGNCFDEGLIISIIKDYGSDNPVFLSNNTLSSLLSIREYYFPEKDIDHHLRRYGLDFRHKILEECFNQEKIEKYVQKRTALLSNLPYIQQIHRYPLNDRRLVSDESQLPAGVKKMAIGKNIITEAPQDKPTTMDKFKFIRKSSIFHYKEQLLDCYVLRRFVEKSIDSDWDVFLVRPDVLVLER